MHWNAYAIAGLGDGTGGAGLGGALLYWKPTSQQNRIWDIPQTSHAVFLFYFLKNSEFFGPRPDLVSKPSKKCTFSFLARRRRRSTIFHVYSLNLLTKIFSFQQNFSKFHIFFTVCIFFHIRRTVNFLKIHYIYSEKKHCSDRRMNLSKRHLSAEFWLQHSFLFTRKLRVNGVNSHVNSEMHSHSHVNHSHLNSGKMILNQ